MGQSVSRVCRPPAPFPSPTLRELAGMPNPVAMALAAGRGLGRKADKAQGWAGGGREEGGEGAPLQPPLGHVR